MRILHKLRHGIHSKILGAGLILIGAAFLLAALNDFLVRLFSNTVGIVVAIIGAALVLFELRILSWHERRHVIYGTVIYLIATLIAFAAGIGLPYQSDALALHHASSTSLALATLAAVIVGSMVYIAFHRFVHRLTPIRHRLLVWISMAAGLFISIILIPANAALGYYGIASLSTVIAILKGLVDIGFAAGYILTGISWV